MLIADKFKQILIKIKMLYKSMKKKFINIDARMLFKEIYFLIDKYFIF